MTTTYEPEVEETDEETEDHDCPNCGARDVNTWAVDDSDPNVGYYSTIYVCGRCA